MANYIVSYNPYQNVASIKKNGVSLNKNGTLCSGINGKRLQIWFDEDHAWPGFGIAIDKDNNGSQCNIEFIGREIDFIDLKDYFDNIYHSERNTSFHLTSQSLSSDEDMLSKLSNLVAELKSKNFFELQQVEAIEKYIRQIKEEPFAISVLATMSSGKSTLLNALMHSELLPTGDAATTAKIMEIYDSGKQTVTYGAYDKNGKLVCEGKNAGLEDIKKINDNTSVYTVRIYSDIPGVDANRIRLLLRDTPGPDGTDDVRHRQIAEAVINDVKSMSTVIYVMDATKLRTESDKELLYHIAYEIKKGGKQANDRFIFVINRVDVWIMKKDQTLEKLLADTKVYLSQFGINSPRIFPVTAGLASDIYKYRSGYEFDGLEGYNYELKLGMFNMGDPKVKFDEYASVSQGVKKQLNADLRKAIQSKDKYEIALIHSGIKGLEYSIKEYMEKYAYPIKVSDAVNDIIGTIDEGKMRRKFLDALCDDERKLETTRKKIEEIKAKKEERQKSKRKFEEEIGSYQLPDLLRDNTGKAVNSAFKRIVDDALIRLSKEEKLKKTDAEALVAKLEIEVTEIEKALDGTIKKMVNDAVYQKGNEILKKYNEYINTIEAGMEIAGFNFREVKELKKFDFDDLKKVAGEVTSRQDITKQCSKQVPNPDRHWWTFWRPKEITETYTEKIGEITYVDKEAVTAAILGISAHSDVNVAEIIEEAKRSIEAFKKFFGNYLDRFSQSIEKIVEELNERLSEENISKLNSENHQRQLKELDSYLEQIKSITDIN